MQNLHAKLTVMETLCASQEKQITLLAASVATAAAAVEVSEKRLTKNEMWCNVM